ncbi:MAG TPA: hypothetical protein VK597_11400, partial [Inquilinus sp.]|nr:hypothetical protein [Inquilinus sp.]
MVGVTDMDALDRSSAWRDRHAGPVRDRCRRPTAGGSGLVTSLDQARFGQQVLLELGDVVQGRLGVLLAG